MSTKNYKITIINNPIMMADKGVRLDLPRLLPFRHGDQHLIFGIVNPGTPGGGVNIPCTGTLSSEDMPHFYEALQLATNIASGKIVLGE